MVQKKRGGDNLDPPIEKQCIERQNRGSTWEHIGGVISNKGRNHDLKLQKVLPLFLVVVCLLSLSIFCTTKAESLYSAGMREFDADAYYDVMKNCAEQIREKTDFKPDIILVLGSGLGEFADEIEIVDEIPYSEIVGFPVSTAPGHEGKLIFGTYNGKNLVLMKGRIHYYEGYSMYDVVLPLRTLSLLGVKTVILASAVGAINEDYATGEFVVVKNR